MPDPMFDSFDSVPDPVLGADICRRLSLGSLLLLLDPVNQSYLSLAITLVATVASREMNIHYIPGMDQVRQQATPRCTAHNWHAVQNGTWKASPNRVYPTLIPPATPRHTPPRRTTLQGLQRGGLYDRAMCCVAHVHGLQVRGK